MHPLNVIIAPLLVQLPTQNDFCSFNLFTHLRDTVQIAQVTRKNGANTINYLDSPQGAIANRKHCHKTF